VIYSDATLILIMSAILRADDLNDFIMPGVACIKPVESGKKGSGEDLEIQIDSEGNALEVTKEGHERKLDKAQISLSDCLACSGCITSAEEVLIAQHSHKELLNALETDGNRKVFVASISHQTRASLASAFDVQIEAMDKVLIYLLKNVMKFKYVIGTETGRRLSHIFTTLDLQNRSPHSEKPLINSTCPGWVLYAEKTHPFILPRISTIKSTQQITGHLLKNIVSKDLGIEKSQIYHLSVMPCFDKKLEAARDSDVPDVDCVITARELVQVIEELNIDLQTILKESVLDNTDIYSVYRSSSPPGWYQPEQSWLNNKGSASGGYAMQYLLDVQQRHADSEIITIEGRNSDIYEHRLVLRDGQVVASSAVVNGFRNIQNLIRKLKPNHKATGGGISARRRSRKLKEDQTGDQGQSNAVVDPSKCDYVEIMACPGGCINGGGQIAAPADQNSKDWINKATTKYYNVPDTEYSDIQLYDWVKQTVLSYDIEMDRLIHTTFKQIERPTDTTSIALGSTW